MAVRTDIVFLPELDPRVILVEAPSTNISIQDLHDTACAWQDSPDGHGYPVIIDSAGKEDLGGGVSVGITTTLQNARLAFEGRKIRTSEATVTTGDATGITLKDSGATFATDGVTAGSWIVNCTDQSSCSVRSVTETELITDGLDGGIDNQFDTSDICLIYTETQCVIDGGNLVAVDSLGATINSVLPTAGTQIVLTSSSSATLTTAQLQQQIKYLIESKQDTHSGFGNQFFWDPVNGLDTNDGLLPESARLTFASVHDDLIVSGNNDVVYLVTDGAAEVIITEQVVITKDLVHLRGPGPQAILKPALSSGAAVDVSSKGVEFDSFIVNLADCTGTAVGINFSSAATFSKVSSVFVHSGPSHAVVFNGGVHHDIVNLRNHDCLGAGVRYIDTKFSKVRQCSFHNNDIGIDLESTTPSDLAWIEIEDSKSYSNTTSDIKVGTGSLETLIGEQFFYETLDDSGTGTRNASTISRALQATETWAEARTSPTSGSVKEALLELFELAGLDPTKPLVVEKTGGIPTARKIPADGTDIDQTIVDTATETTVTRV